jgi:DNA-binding MarR family transcriptional regulator
VKIEDAIKQKKFADPYHKVMVNLLYTSNWLVYMESGVFKRHGLTMPQYNVLRILKGQLPNAATVNLLIERMLDKSSNASRIVEKLRAKGLIDRHECKMDRRRVDVKINEKGLALLELASADMKKFYTNNQSLTPDEASLLSDLLDKLRGDKELK